ncbi:hypothetical protein [Arthrobacter sp. B3I4]|uniref:hypothetical protein n=1 Tax=Arthrobacter sp. B3I4 TaxID=3042267 RepID=UPI002780D4AE|nr:hypothetical protein [Arthrobacter sp. B3I4]MDQ0756095.1 hypothetical protein [Arthrobacter sp. B3I4]
MNSARRLLVLIDGWRTSTASTSVARRGDGNPASMQFWAEHRLAMQLMDDVESALNALATTGTDMSAYRSAVPAWYSAIFSMPLPWHTQGTNPRELISEDKLNMLGALASLLDVVNWEPAWPGEEADIFETLTHAEQLLRDDLSIADATKRYLLGLIEELRYAVQNMDENGNAPARKVSMELVGAMTTLAVTTPNPNDRKKWFTVAMKIAKLVGVSAVTKVVEGGIDEIIRMLEA